jgi:PTH1 family peptidyl-tRNA hydrolase
MSPLKKLFDRFRSRSAAESPSRVPGKAAQRWLVVGFGNPGGQYRNSLHNLGFMVVDRLAARYRAKLSRRKFNALYGEAELDGHHLMLMQPQTYYNETGPSVASNLGYFKIPSERLIVVHDELDLERGQMRLKRGGGDAGNRGIRSLIEALGSGDFIRLRIGIGHPIEGKEDIDYLLEPMSAETRKWSEEVVERAADAVAAVIIEGLERAMGRVNRRSRDKAD